MVHCSQVAQYSSTDEQCKFLLDNPDCLLSDALIDYVDLVYCKLGVDLRALSVCLIGFLVIMLFWALGTIVDEFLCPNLLALSKKMRLSDSLAGITLLAFGNGCTDIFSSWLAAAEDRTDLILGELLGAGIFCTSVIIGFIFIRFEFNVARFALLRDAVFYTLAVALIWHYCANQQVTFSNSITLVLLYVSYIIFALVSQTICARRNKHYSLDDDSNNNNNDNDNSNEKKSVVIIETTFDNNKQSTTTTLQPQVQYTKRGSIAPHLFIVECQVRHSTSNQLNVRRQTESALPINKLANIIMSHERNEDQLGVYEVKCAQRKGSLRSLTSGASQQQQQRDYQHGFTTMGVNSNNKSITGSRASLDSNNAAQQGSFKRHYSASSNYNYNNNNSLIDDDEIISECKKGIANANATQSTSRDSNNNNNSEKLKNCCHLAVELLRAPIYYAALVTIPVVDTDKPASNWQRSLNALHVSTAAITALALLEPKAMLELASSDNIELTFLDWLSIISGIIALIVVPLLIRAVTVVEQEPSWHSLFAFLGFTMSILWIFRLTKETLSLLKLVGIMFGLSDTVIGLTVLAWGNSLGDVIANTSLAAAGYPRMALGASIGSPLLNLLIGFGVSFCFKLGNSSTRPSVKVDSTPFISLLCSTLLLILLLLVAFAALPAAASNRLRKLLGFLLMSIYVAYMSFAIWLETRAQK